MLGGLFKKQKSEEKPQIVPDIPQGAEVICLPQMGDNMRHGKVSKWLFKVGDYVNVGDILAEVETDKATMELDAYVSGTVLYITEMGVDIPIDGVLMVIGNPNTDVSELLKANSKVARQPKLIGNIGEVKLFAGQLIPEGWLKCNGQAYNIDEYPALHQVIENQFGGVGNRQFNVPQLEPIGKVGYFICAE